MRDFNIEDLLPREPIEVDMKAIAAEIKEKCILVTGAAGFIWCITRRLRLLGT